MSDKLDLNAILARADAAPEGPWASDHGELGSDVYRLRDGGPLIVDLSPELAEFIAAARTDVPALVAEMRRLEHRLRQTTERERVWVGMAVQMADQSMPAAPDEQPAGDWRSRPTSEEIDAHHAAHTKGGQSWWVVTYPDEVDAGREPYVWVSFGQSTVHGVGVGGQPSPAARWSPRDARLMPVAWPVTK